MQKFNSNGFEIGFQKLENAGSENVLFIHGNLASKEWFYPSMELMSAKPGRGTVIAADWRGYGDSTGLTSVDQINFETFAADFVSLLEDQKLNDVNVVGHSTGGLVAMLAIQQKPELFKSLTLLDSVGATGLILDLPKDQVLAHFDQMAADSDYSKAVYVATIKDADMNSESFNKLFDIMRKADQVMFRGVIEAFTSGIDYRESFAQIKQPTLILHGEEDPVLKLSMSESLRDLIPGAQMKVMDNQGHSMNMENPERFVQEITQFWASI